MSVLRRFGWSLIVFGVVGFAVSASASVGESAATPEGFTEGAVEAQDAEDRSLLDVVLGFEAEIEPDLLGSRAKTEESREARAPESHDRTLSVTEQSEIWESAPTVVE